MNKNEILKLNKEQLEAVNYIDGPCLVLAGAGSGKTRVLTERIVNLINNGVRPQNILAITFTNKAANEMRERVRNRLGDISDSIFIGTFHSFGLKIVRENYDAIGYSRNITIMDRDDMASIIKKLIKELNLENQNYDYRYVIDKISSAKNDEVSPEEFSKLYLSDFDYGIDKIYKRYEVMIKNNNSVDFDDLLTLPLTIFRKNKEILEKYQEHFQYILVDEYQDTNKIQYNLCKMLASKNRNIFVVGDIDQSIFSWRKADYENILLFEKDYKDTKVIFLEENYRSTNNILKAANSIIKNNTMRKEKNLWSSKGDGEKITYTRCNDEKEESGYVVNKIKEMLKDGYSYSDFAVLYRTNAQSRTLEEEFLKENISYKVFGSYYFYGRKEIKDLISYLHLIYNPHDFISLDRVINVPKRGIGLKTIEKLREVANERNISVFEAIESGKELEFKNLILSLVEDSKNMSLTELVDHILIKSGMKKSFEESGNLDDEIRLENLEEFKSITKASEENGTYDLEEFLGNIALVSDIGQYNNNDNAVTLMTLHSSKGLEFRVVFIIGMEEGIFPHFRSFSEVKELEEERRLCYVGITRAEEKLYLLNARRRMIFGKITENIPSRFINEIEDELLDVQEELTKSNNGITKKLFNMYKENYNEDLRVGDKVFHTLYKEGVVVNIDRDLATIAFSREVGIKKMKSNHISLKKISRE